MNDLERRALAAYYRAANAELANYGGGSVMQPSPPETVEVDGLTYIRLTNVRGILAVYRVRMVNGKPMLKGLKRWPAAVDV